MSLMGSPQWMYATETAFSIPQSIRFDGASTYLHRTPASESNRKTYTLSVWVKIAEIADPPWGGEFLWCIDDSSTEIGSLFIYNNHQMSNPMGGASGMGQTNRHRFADHTAWYHIVQSIDTTLADSGAGTTANTDRHKTWVNGVRIDDWTTGWGGYVNGRITEDYEGNWNKATQHEIGCKNGASNFFNGYMAEIHFLDGVHVTDATDFGEFGDYGEWKPIETEGLTYGTNGYYLDFADSADLGKDVSGEGNHWTSVGFAAHDQVLDTPTANFCTLNNKDKRTDITLSEGSLKAVTTTGDWRAARGTFSNSTGKWYYEVQMVTSVGDGVWSHGVVGVLKSSFEVDPNNIHQYDSNWGYETQGQTWNGASAENTSLSAITAGDIIQVAYDMDAGKIWWGVNNTWILSGDPGAGSNAVYSNLSGAVNPYTDMYYSNSSGTFIFNFGQDSSFAGTKTAQGNGASGDDFYYTPPSGFKSLKASNLPDPAVIPSEHFNTILYTGNGVSGRAMTGVGFQPDLVWTKSRSDAYRHAITDALLGATNTLCPSSNAAVSTDDVFDSFDSDGFTLGNDDASNYDTKTYVAWNWKAASTASGTTTGSGTGKSYSAQYNTDAGFSIVSYEGNGTAGHEIPHHLSAALDCWIVKRKGDTDYWAIGHSGIASDYETDYIHLNTGDAAADSDDYWDDTKPTSSVFTCGGTNDVNGDTDNYIAYCFHSVEGYSKCGKYLGNDTYSPYSGGKEPSVYLGFRPAFIMIKRSDGSGNWNIWDSARNDRNLNPTYIVADTNAAETGINQGGTSGEGLDVTANGFLLTGAGDAVNADSNYIYLAFAKTPFKYANAF